MAAGLGRHLIRPEAAGRRAARGAACARSQQAGIHAVGLGHEVLGVRVEHQTGVALVYLLHDLKPDIGRIAAVQAVQRVVMLIADPHRSGILRGHAAEPDIRVRGGGTGLAGGLHARNLRTGCGAVRGDVLHAVQHVVRGAHVLEALVGIRGVLQNHVALGVQHLGIGAGAAEHALVDEGCKAARHLAHGDAVGQAAERQRRQIDIRLGRAVLIGAVCHQLDIQLLGQKVVGFLRGQRVEHLYRDGIDRACDTAFDRHRAAGRHSAVVHRPGHAVFLPQRAVVHGRARHDYALIHRRAVGRQRLEGRTGLAARIGRKRKFTLAGLFAAAARDADNVAHLIGDDHCALRTLAVFLRIREDRIIRPNLIKDVLDVGINGCIDLEAAGVYHIAGNRFGIALLLHQIVDHIADDRVGKVAVGLAYILDIGLIRTVDQLLCHSRVVLRLVDHALIEHLVENDDLALLDLIRMVVHVVDRGVVGQAREHRTFRERQLGHILAEVGVGRGLHAVAAVAEVDRVEVHGQDAVLVVYHVLQRKRAEDLVDLTLDRIIVLIRCVLDQLLGDGRAAVLRAAEQPVFHRAQRALPVDAVVRVKALVLDRDHRVLEVLRDLLAVHPFAALQAAQRFIQRLLPGLRVGRIDKRIQVQAEVVADLGRGLLCGGVDIGMDVVRKRNAAETGAKHTDKQQRQQYTGDDMPDAGTSFFASCQFGLLLARRAFPLGSLISIRTQSASVLFPTSVMRRFSSLPPHQCHCFLTEMEYCDTNAFRYYTTSSRKFQTNFTHIKE